MMTPKRIWLTLVLLLVLVTLVVGGAFFDCVGPVSKIRGEFCVQCGARSHFESNAFRLFFIQIPLSSSAETNLSPLTGLWTKYCGGCRHDWAFGYYNERSPLLRTFADGFPSQDYPVGQVPEVLSNGVESLEGPGARATALRAIGHRENLLRFMAAGAVISVGDLDAEHRKAFVFENWWGTHSNVFLIVTNKGAAEDVLRRWENLPDNRIEHSVEQSRELIRRMESRRR